MIKNSHGNIHNSTILTSSTSVHFGHDWRVFRHTPHIVLLGMNVLLILVYVPELNNPCKVTEITPNLKVPFSATDLCSMCSGAKFPHLFFGGGQYNCVPNSFINMSIQV